MKDKEICKFMKDNKMRLADDTFMKQLEEQMDQLPTPAIFNPDSAAFKTARKEECLRFIASHSRLEKRRLQMKTVLNCLIYILSMALVVTVSFYAGVLSTYPDSSISGLFDSFIGHFKHFFQTYRSFAAMILGLVPLVILIIAILFSGNKKDSIL